MWEGRHGTHFERLADNLFVLMGYGPETYVSTPRVVAAFTREEGLALLSEAHTQLDFWPEVGDAAPDVREKPQ